MKRTSSENLSYIYIIMIILFSVLGIAMLLFAIVGQEEKTVSFNEQAEIEDVITLKENNYFEEGQLTNQATYITSLIDAMNLNYKYTMTPSEKTDYQATYYITANLKIYEVGEPSNVYWSNDETLVEEKELTTSDKIDINESVAIDFNRYNQLVTDFSKDYALLLDSTLDVTLHIALTNEEEELNKTKTVTATIPMNKQSFSITKNTKTNPLEEVTIKTHNFNVLYLIFAIIILVFDAIFIKRLIGYLKENVLNKNKYQKEIEKILKTYDQIIVISKNPPDIENVKKIEVENFEELLDAQEELNNPIIFYENKTTHRSMFVIIGQEIAWIYHLIDEENKVLEVL